MDSKILVAIINTLNGIRVSGKEDMQKMLGLITLFEGWLKTAEEEENDKGH